MRRFIALFVFLMMLASIGAVAGQDDDYIRHVVAPGDNLFRISLRYGVSMASIQAANPIIRNRNLIYAGTTLLIPRDGTTPPTGQPPTPRPTQQPTQRPTQRPTQQPSPTPPPGQEQTYTVVRGDTLGRIASRFGTTTLAIARRNGIANPNLIFAGQVLIIPGTSSGTPPTPTPVPTEPAGPTPPPTTGAFELGGQVISFAYPEQMRGAGMTWVKRQLVWNQGDPASIAQSAISGADSEGFKILLSIKGQPAQLAANPSQYYQDFAAFLGGVAQLGPDAIEVWNEQNIDREWPTGHISPQAYTQMLSAAYNAIKAANSEVIVISGAPAPTGFFDDACTTSGCDDAPFLRGMRDAGAAGFMDCLGMHYNEGVLSPDARSGDPRGNDTHHTRYYPTMVETYSEIFPDKQLCFTELGYLSPEGYGPLPANFSWASQVTVQDQAAWLARAATLSRSGGLVRLLIVWNVDATEYGADPQAGYAIIRPNNTCLACNTLGAAMQ